MEDLDFDWHEIKRLRNLRDHEVDFYDAVKIWADPRRQERLDNRHEYGESRWQTIGMTHFKVLFVVYTDRSFPDGGEVTWIVSARLAEKWEIELYLTSKFALGRLS